MLWNATSGRIPNIWYHVQCQNPQNYYKYNPRQCRDVKRKLVAGKDKVMQSKIIFEHKPNISDIINQNVPFAKKAGRSMISNKSVSKRKWRTHTWNIFLRIKKKTHYCTSKKMHFRQVYKKIILKNANISEKNFFEKTSNCASSNCGYSNSTLRWFNKIEKLLTKC